MSVHPVSVHLATVQMAIVHSATVRSVRHPLARESLARESLARESLARECLEPGSLDGEVKPSEKWLVQGCSGKTVAAIERALGRAIRSALRRG